VILRRFETLRSKQRRTDPPFGGELGEANALAGIHFKFLPKSFAPAIPAMIINIINVIIHLLLIIVLKSDCEFKQLINFEH
jgi:hypothetical protein